MPSSSLEKDKEVKEQKMLTFEEEEVICFVTSKIFVQIRNYPGQVSVDHLGPRPCNLKSISTLDQSLEREKLVP